DAGVGQYFHGMFEVVEDDEDIGENKEGVREVEVVIAGSGDAVEIADGVISDIPDRAARECAGVES
ncbi:hypothetical protein LCGC14_3153160, partial [marine sediment metagenome]